MQSEVQNVSHKNKSKKRNRLTLVAIAAILVVIFGVSMSSFATLSKDTVHKGVSINGKDASGLSYDSLIEELGEEYDNKLNDLEVTLKTDEVSKKASFKDLKVTYDLEAAANQAFSVGRDGNMFKRLYDVLSASATGHNVEVPVSFDTTTLNNFLDSFDNLVSSDVKKEELIISDQKVTLRSGQQQKDIDLDLIKAEVVQLIEEGKGDEIDVEVVNTPPAKIDLDALYAQLNVDPINASFTMENGKLAVVPHKEGMSVSKDVLSQIINDLDGKYGFEKEIPVEYTQPQLTAESAKNRLFTNDLAYYSTKFNTNTTNNANRAHNMRLASSKINGKILLPGEEFSFNNIVGPRSTATGYKSANIYSAGAVVDGVGGGICQVSSTLYGAILRADLDVSYRRNHSLTVGYVPYGQDATVSYGAVDFKFINSTGWPVKVSAGITNDNIMYFKLTGTNTNPDKKVSISSTTLQTIPFTEKFIDDPNLDEGKTIVMQNGKNGYVVDTFVTTTVGGKVVSKEKIHTSKYNPLAKEIKRGTKPVVKIPEVPVVPDPPVTPPGEVTDPTPPPPAVPPGDTTDLPDAPPANMTDDDLSGVVPT